MLTDYKIQRITRDPDGRVEVVYQAYEGVVATVEEEVEPDQRVLVTRYRRSAPVGSVQVLAWSDDPSEAAIRTRLNQQLATDETRTPIDEQRNV
jgi:hypothetical protein